MDFPHVLSCGVYRAPEKNRVVTFQKWICFNVSGLVSACSFYPDGVKNSDSMDPGCSLSLSYPGFADEFEYGANREDFVLMLEFDAFRYDAETHELYLQNGPVRNVLRQRVPVVEEDVPELRERFALIARLSSSGLASDNLKADILAAGLFRYFLGGDPPPDSPAAVYRKKIDEDRSYKLSLREHAQSLGMNCDYLRREFTALYGMTPCEYREHRRRNDLLSRITYTGDSFKEIAAGLGLKHVQHLNLLVQKYFGCTPKKLAARFRRQQTYITPEDTEE